MRMTKRTADYRPCPDPVKGQICQICGGSFICLQSWRKEKTPEARLAAKQQYRKGGEKP